MFRSRLAAVRLWIRLALAPGKRGGLALQRAPSLFQFLLQSFDFTLQPFVVLAQALNLLQCPIQFHLGNKLQGLSIRLRGGSRLPGLAFPFHP